MSRTIHSIDPASEELLWEGLAATAEEIANVLASARQAFPAWAATPLGLRMDHVRAFKSTLEARSGEMAATIARETGKPHWEARAEVASMIAKVETSIAAQVERAGERRSATEFGEAVLRHHPHGVAAILGPFNFPGHLPNGHIVPALLAGNCVVFKPSDLTPLTGEVVAEIWRSAALPEGVFNLVQGGGETGAELVDGDIDGLFFTGSFAVGAQIRRRLVDRPQVITALELSGNNPLLVWDGDLEEIASLVAQSSFITTGQRCSCARRLIVPDTAFGAAVIDAVANLGDRLAIGAWDESPKPYMGPLISREAADFAQSQVDRLIGLGARVVTAFKRVAGRSEAFVTPAVLDVTGLDAPDEEIFAPVLQVTRVPDLQEAIAAANRTRFGLAAGLVSADNAVWESFLLNVRAGVINRNRPTTGAAGTMPFGGVRESGNHRPSAYYAADYCAYPVASFEAATAAGNARATAGLVRV